VPGPNSSSTASPKADQAWSITTAGSSSGCRARKPSTPPGLRPERLSPSRTLGHGSEPIGLRHVARGTSLGGRELTARLDPKDKTSQDEQVLGARSGCGVNPMVGAGSGDAQRRRR